MTVGMEHGDFQKSPDTVPDTKLFLLHVFCLPPSGREGQVGVGEQHMEARLLTECWGRAALGARGRKSQVQSCGDLLTSYPAAALTASARRWGRAGGWALGGGGEGSPPKLFLGRQSLARLSHLHPATFLPTLCNSGRVAPRPPTPQAV